MIRVEKRYGKCHCQGQIKLSTYPYVIDGQIDMSKVEPSAMVRREHVILEWNIDGLLSFSVGIMISTTK
jgi:hypothetical protein